ncbi:chromosome-associated kinesin KIF4-like, partial [Aphidius gifuensis]|uniref:chromosome-associated kinesin KIF4-like n=1 Tax=Aphidius gifuensis TaxID=684658 RepID=UPI001CDD7D2B
MTAKNPQDSDPLSCRFAMSEKSFIEVNDGKPKPKGLGMHALRRRIAGLAFREGVNIEDIHSLNVFIKIRPLNKKEIEKNENQIIYPSKEFLNTLSINNKYTYEFDKIFYSDIDNKNFFLEAIVPRISNFLLGYDSTILTYGQTSSGKTYTIEEFIKKSKNNKHIASTLMNASSSRSHCVLKFKRKSKNIIYPNCFSIIDLAGSEKQNKTEATGHTLAEGNTINKSLSCLSKVIHTLSRKKKNDFIPYRESKLTHLLKDSLTNKLSQVLIIICCSPALSNVTETKSSLDFVSDIFKDRKINNDNYRNIYNSIIMSSALK